MENRIFFFIFTLSWDDIGLRVECEVVGVGNRVSFPQENEEEKISPQNLSCLLYYITVYR